MIPALLLGRKGSKGFPGKNTHMVLGNPLCWYPMRAAKNAGSVDMVFLSTDDEKLMEIAVQNDVHVIERPEYLCNDTALGEDAYVHGFNEIKRMYPDERVDIVVLLFCNAATINSKTIDEGIRCLVEDDTLDSAVTVSRYNMWSPLRARKLEGGLLRPFVPFEVFGDPATLNCDRDSQGDVLFADMGCSIVRCRCLENLESGLLPQKWMGNRIVPLHQEAGCDVDYEWQIPMVKWWLEKYGE